MSSYQVVITNVAQRDLLDIFDYISFELKEPESARRLLSKIKAKVLSLVEMPESHKLISEVSYKEKNIKWAPIENYIIFYQVSDLDNIVYILRVLYKKRDWEQLLNPSS